MSETLLSRRDGNLAESERRMSLLIMPNASKVTECNHRLQLGDCRSERGIVSERQLNSDTPAGSSISFQVSLRDTYHASVIPQTEVWG